MILEFQKSSITLLKDPQAPSFCTVKSIFENEDGYGGLV
jgi:hypothetical protein